jgi:hypothetical protein
VATTHWFDALSFHLASNTSRRGVLRTSGGLAIAGIVASVRQSSAGNNKKKKKDKDKDNKDKPKRTCSRGRCKRQWAGDQAEINHCEFICRQCDGNDPRHFCIADFPSPGSPDKAAVCCDPTETCCGSECAHLPTSQFHCGKCNFPCPNGSACYAGECRSLCGPDGAPCPEDPSVCCREGNTCCPGFGCVNTDAHPRNCGGCGIPCGVGHTCIGGECQFTDPPGWEWCETDTGWVGVYTTGPLAANRLHCGGCNLECPGNFPQGQWCFEGSCGCGDDRRWCGEELGCVPDALPC